MKLAIMRAIRLTILMILPSVLIAQESKDYNVLLNSGKFIPNENIVGLTRSSQVFIASKSGDRHYVSLQFKSIPTNDDKERLKSAGIQLGDYIPNYSFTASLNADFNIDVLKSADLRSVFVLSAAQKSVPALLRGEYPPHALKAPGFVDLTIITYELLPVEKLATALMTYGATIVENMPMFRSLVIRVPLASAKNIPSASFIQWAEFVDPPNQLENLLGRSLHRVNTLQDGVRNLKGDGMKIGVWDEVLFHPV